MRKKIAVSITIFNEQKNIIELYERLVQVFHNKLNQYDYDIIFIDNKSKDDSRIVIEELCLKDKHVKAIFNSGNYGQSRSNFYGIISAVSDCTISLAGDLQDPPEVICEMVEQWEQGHKVVIGIKSKSKENFIMYGIRHMYYTLMKKISDIDHIPHFTLFALYDSSFVQLLHGLNDPNPYLKGIVAEYGGDIAKVEYTQEKRKNGKSSYNFLRLYDVAMLSITSCTRNIIRFATIISFIFAGLCFLFAIGLFVYKIIFWDRFIGNASIIVSIFLIGAIQLAFMGLIAEYIMNINTKIVNKPLIMEERRLNFNDDIEES